MKRGTKDVVAGGEAGQRNGPEQRASIGSERLGEEIRGPLGGDQPGGHRNDGRIGFDPVMVEGARDDQGREVCRLSTGTYERHVKTIAEKARERHRGNEHLNGKALADRQRIGVLIELKRRRLAVGGGWPEERAH